MKYVGKGLVAGRAAGTIIYIDESGFLLSQKDCDAYIDKHSESITNTNIYDSLEQIERYNLALAGLLKELNESLEDISALGEDDEYSTVEKNLIEAHIMLTQDEGLSKKITDYISEKKVSAKEAVSVVCEDLIQRFGNLGDEILIAKQDDIRDIGNRLLTLLSDKEELGYTVHNTGTSESDEYEEGIILVADKLLPSEFLRYQKGKIAGLVINSTSPFSHVIILAKAMKIPVVIDVEPLKEWNKKRALLDGDTGVILVEPDEGISKETLTEKSEGESDSEKKDILIHGKKILVGINISYAEELSASVIDPADGIGLFRSEMPFLAADHWLSEDEQFEIYKELVLRMNGKPVIVRTLDVGADKTAPYMNMQAEENPMLGLRGIRFCLERRDIFKTQLRALLRAGEYGDLRIMYPMISSVEELDEAKKIYMEAFDELIVEGYAIHHVKSGAMIETPAAVLCAEKLAKQVDFFSIGTNDLIQYACAVDRNNTQVASLYNNGIDTVMSLIETTVLAAHEAGIQVGVCGELASDEDNAYRLVRLGIDELSVAPVMLKTIRNNLLFRSEE